MTPRQVRDENEISLFALGTTLLRNRWRLIRWAVAGAVLAALTVISKPRLYRAHAAMVPQGVEQGRSNLASLAGQLGVTLPGGAQTTSSQFYADLATSRAILVPLTKLTFTVPELGGRRVQFMELFEIGGETPAVREERAVNALKGMVTAPVNPTTGVIGLTVKTPWRSVSLAITEALVTGLNEYNERVRQGQAAGERRFVEQRLAEATIALRAAEDRLERFLRANREFGGSPQLVFERERLQRDVNLRQQVYTSLMQAYEEARIREVRDTPVITVFETPWAPALPEPRGRIRRTVLGGILGGFVGMVLIATSAMVARSRRDGDPEAEEFVRALRDTKRDLLRHVPGARARTAG